MKEKKYLYIIIVLVILFVGFNFITWTLITKEVFIHKKNIHIGDLGRMSFLKDLLAIRKNEQNLVSKHLDYSEINIDVLTIGDSFSNGGPGGLNPYYQDYISTNQNLKVMNIQSSNKGFIETVLILIDTGILDKLKPKAIILESVERAAINRYSKKIDWNIGLKYNSMSFLNSKYRHDYPAPSFITHLNYNALLYSMLYKYDDNAIFSKVYKTSITKKLFSCKDRNKLLFYYDDLKNIPLSNNTSISLLNNNLNKLQSILKDKNIKLYFMPSVDKYNLYSTYILNNPYPESTFFELLRPLKKKYHFIDTKKILSNLLENDTQDVYYSDDTHWSNKASEEIFNRIQIQ